ncbi:hypothetical protein LWI28_013564 [Acer negundo]|uniref:Uncharacterized protein n=1 Tax=Acer negundo TaxID=4023 RepID=A0AAD5JAY8_ACENE|nr:hypothetical protein LWI28_013564 [Acer negundo]
MNDPKDSSSTNPTSGTQGSNDPLFAQGPNDSFFVNHSDNPTAVLVSPKLSGDNYNTGSLTGTLAGEVGVDDAPPPDTTVTQYFLSNGGKKGSKGNTFRQHLSSTSFKALQQVGPSN